VFAGWRVTVSDPTRSVRLIVFAPANQSLSTTITSTITTAGEDLYLFFGFSVRALVMV
jgi:hypothetical protein